MHLPEDFAARMRDLLGADGFAAFEQTAEKPAFRGLRVNTLKTDTAFLLPRLGFAGAPSPFCPDGYYLADGVDHPGSHPLHHAGAYYLQEPSASSAVTALAVAPGDTVLDLCAAPGGKSTQIAAALGGTGLLWSNEYVRSRVNPLLSNIERMGIANAVVSATSAEEIAAQLPACFDKVLVDAPCSGEGMFRKEPQALQQWSVENSRSCGERQSRILHAASACVKGGGYLCYSTCTFSPDENEKVIARFLEEHPSFSLVPIAVSFGIPGCDRYTPDHPELALTRRILPQNGGEGHFVALMRREDGPSVTIPEEPIRPSEAVACFECFAAENGMAYSDRLKPFSIGNAVYLSPLHPAAGRSIVRCGLLAGEMRGARFEPAHALFASPAVRTDAVFSLSLDDPRLRAYLHGEEISCIDTLRGYVRVAVENIPLSFGKAANGRLKNHYPKGLRIL